MLPGLESDYWKETQIHGSKVFLLDIVDIVAFFQKCYVQGQKSEHPASKTSGLKQNFVRIVEENLIDPWPFLAVQGFLIDTSYLAYIKQNWQG